MAEREIEESANIVQSFQCSGDETDFNSLTAAYRVLRNYCASGRHAQTTLAGYDRLLEKTEQIVHFLLSSSREHGDLCLLVSLQFVANFLVDNKPNQRKVWETFDNVLTRALQYEEGKIQNCALMIIYNVLLDNEELLLQCDKHLDEIIRLTQNEVTAEYAAFILELFVCKTSFITRHFKNLEYDQKLIVLSVIEAVQRNPDGPSFPSGMLSFFAEYFVEKSHCVLETDPNEMNPSDANEMSLILDLINSVASSNARYLTEIQTCHDLLIHSIGLLRVVHELSKEKGNQFSMLLKLADLEAANRSETLEEHPAFGFKGALVRLIGNMCWRHQRHQDTAREMEAIPLILDCCNIDARNPLIIQWAVLAMRNLCENNVENQRVVACVDRRGQVDSARLAELGLLFNGAGQPS